MRRVLKRCNDAIFRSFQVLIHLFQACHVFHLHMSFRQAGMTTLADFSHLLCWLASGKNALKT